MDKRIVRTRSAIRRYVLSQLKEKDISDFSVSEICEACDLSRSTFYLHYKSVEDVVHEISDGVIGTIVAVVETALPSEALSKVGAYLRKNADEIGVLLQADEGYLIHQLSAKIEPIVQQMETVKNDSLSDYLASFITYGSIGLFRHWLNGDRKMTVPQFMDKLTECVNALKRHAAD